MESNSYNAIPLVSSFIVNGKLHFILNETRAVTSIIFDSFLFKWVGKANTVADLGERGDS